MRVIRWIAQSVLTVTVGVLTATASVAALASPDLLDRWTADAALLRGGQWWRAVTPVLVQPAGWGQLAFNLLGLLVAGWALERRTGRPAWALVYLFGGAGALAVTTAWQPQVGSGGSSDAVAAMVGALVVLQVVDARWVRPGWPAQLYAVFFATYLTTVALAGFAPAVVVGNGAIVAYAVARRAVRAEVLMWGVTAVVVVAGVLMVAARDGHGVGILVGGAVAALILGRRALGQGAGWRPVAAAVVGVWALTLATWIVWVPLLGVDLAVMGAEGEYAQVGWVSVSVTAVLAAVAAWLVLRLLLRAWPRVAVRVWGALCALLTVLSLAAPAQLALGATSRAALILLHLTCGAGILGLVAPPSGRTAERTATEPVDRDVTLTAPPVQTTTR